MLARPTSFYWPVYQERNPRLAWMAGILGLVAAIAWADYATGYDISLLVAYLVPIFLATWMIGKMAGLFSACLAVVLWVIAFASKHPFSHVILFALEALLQLAVYIVFVIVLDRLKTALSHADERFAAVLEGLDALVYVFYAGDGRVLYVNQKCREAFGGMPRNAREIELSQRLVTAGEMASLLAHELNQPLAAIANYNTGCVNRLRSGNWQAREILEALEKSVVQARRAGGIIQRVREFLGKREPDLAPCDLAAIIIEVSSMVSADAKRYAVNLRLALDRGLPPAQLDGILIKQVILNLIKNGIESMQDTPADRRDLHVRLSADTRETLHVEVADRGCGLPAELAADPVRPFYTTKPYGIGMGLQICRSIIEMHGGRLWATPNPEGARCSISRSPPPAHDKCRGRQPDLRRRGRRRPARFAVLADRGRRLRGGGVTAMPRTFSRTSSPRAAAAWCSTCACRE